MTHSYLYQTSIGKIIISDDENGICRLEITNSIELPRNELFETPLIASAAKQLHEYLNGIRKEFNLPLSPKGTEFQKKVWKQLLKIPYGETLSYKQLAEKIGNPKASRAVGMANNKNPIIIIIPCHRVIGTNGNLTGYAAGITLKEKLLVLEKEINNYEQQSC